MLENRIRDIRRQKGITLHELAARIKPRPTTAQTIGRLETGTRTLSLQWMNKIAKALDCEPAELLNAPGYPTIPVVGELSELGKIIEIKTMPGNGISIELDTTMPAALRIGISAGNYLAGDLLILDQSEKLSPEDNLNHDCLAEERTGKLFFGKLIKGRKSGRYTIIPPGPEAEIQYDIDLKRAARTTTLIRKL